MMRRLHPVIGVRASLRVLVASSAIAVGAAVAGAQRAPTVMAHGIRSDANAWTETGSALAATLPLRVVRPSLPWRVLLTEQAGLLRDRLTTEPDTSFAIGHSNGGLVLRQAARDGRRFKALATVGSANSGAPLARNVRDGRIAGLWQPLLFHLSAIAAAYASPVQNPLPGEQQYAPDLDYAQFFAALVSDAMLGFLDFDPRYPVWGQMYPSSAFHNGPDALSSPASQAA